MQQNTRSIAILGSTGSIGTQAIDVIREQKDRFTVEVLTSNNNVDLLIQQAKEFKPNAVVIGETRHYEKLRDALTGEPVKVFAGTDALEQVVPDRFGGLCRIASNTCRDTRRQAHCTGQ